jgi:hypothetical protein
MIFEDIINNRPAKIGKIAFLLRKIIFESLTNIDERIYGGKKVQNALYSTGGSGNVICGIQASENYCILYIHKSNQVDTSGLKLEGSGKYAKHIKFKNAEEIDQNKIGAVLKHILLVIQEDIRKKNN